MIYPNLDEARRESIYLVRSRQIDLERRSKRIRGLGRSFESLREYRDGDEVRDICWTASARRGKLVTRLFEIERSQTIWIVIDSGRLMRTRGRRGLEARSRRQRGALARAGGAAVRRSRRPAGLRPPHHAPAAGRPREQPSPPDDRAPRGRAVRGARKPIICRRPAGSCRIRSGAAWSCGSRTWPTRR